MYDDLIFNTCVHVQIFAPLSTWHGCVFKLTFAPIGLRPSRARPGVDPVGLPELSSVELCSPPCPPSLFSPAAVLLVRRRAAVLGEAALISNGSTELGSDVTEELTACMIAQGAA